jgi:hypothetical protein
VSAYTRPLLKSELQAIRERLTEADVLDESAGIVLDSIVAQVDAMRSPKKWRFVITQQRPLRFRTCTTADCKDVKFDTTVDISGVFPAPVNGAPSKEHSVVVRVWTTDPAVWFVEQLDAARLLTDVDPAKGRVVHRFHFDAASSPDEPWSHLHVGGRNRHDDECFRFPEDQALPRFFHHPMGLIQACEFVLYHFFPTVYLVVSEEESWKFALTGSQGAYLDKHWTKLKQFARNGLGTNSYHKFCCVAP